MLDKFREPEDLLSDPSFLSWYFKTGEDASATWDQWMNGHADRRLLVEKAITLLETARLPEIGPSQQQQQKAEAALFDRLSALPSSPRTTIGRIRWIAAASVLVAIVTGIIIVRYMPHTPSVERTNYEQIASRRLPDGTEVTLNANSSLRYGSNWNDTEDREVWVDGEAYFHVKRTLSNSRFIVHSGHFDVIVTGTQFNVYNRHGKDNVLLQEGSVTVRTKDGKITFMKPGEFVTFDSLLEKKTANPRQLVWKDQMMSLDGTPMSQVATMIEDMYGVHVQLKGDTTANMKVSTMVPSNNLNRLAKALEFTGDFEISYDSLKNDLVIRGLVRNKK
jgi:ferric-dicitrate binding protein FerR (iron transport regulator)